MPKREVLKQAPSTGNGIRDLGLADADPAAAAQLMGIDQPKISAMPAGQFRGYSVERLMRFLVALGHAAQS